MKKFIITLITLLLIVGAALGGAYIYRTKRKNSDPVKVYPVSYFVGNWYESSSSFSGNVVVSDEQNIYIEKDKLVKGIYASPGDSVKAGDVILEYDTTQESLKLDTMYAQLQVSYTDLRLAENQLEKLNNTTPIEDDAEIPKTPAEKKLEEAEKKLDEANNGLIEPEKAYSSAMALSDEAEKLMNGKYKDLEDAIKLKKSSASDLLKFYDEKINKPATPEENTNPDVLNGSDDIIEEPEAEEPTTEKANPNDYPEDEQDKKVEEIKKEVSEKFSGGEKPDSDIFEEYTTLLGAYNAAINNLNRINSEYIEAYNDFNTKLLDTNKKQTEYLAAEEIVDAAQKEYDDALEAVAKEQDEQLENPEIVYTKTELARAIRLKNEEIRNLNLRIQNQNLSIKRQEKAIEKCKVLAEFDGVVRFNEVTDDVYSGMSPAIVIDASGVYSAVINVDELSLDEIYIGEQVDIFSYDTGMSYTGKVSKIAENPSESGGYYEYTASSYPVSVVIDGGEDLNENMWVEVTTAQTSNYESLQNEIVIPLALCKKENASYYVMKRENGRLKKQVISTGKIYYGTEIVVKAGITASDYIAFPYEKDAVEGKVCKEADLSDLYDY